MTQHTPWDHSGAAGHETHGQSVVYDSTGKSVAVVYDGDAHARLIAAAPELLEVAQWVLKRLDLEPVDAVFPCSALREDIRAAIAKATGQ